MFLPRRISSYLSASSFTYTLLYSTPNLIFNASHHRHLLVHACDACSLTSLLLVFILIVDSGISGCDTGTVQSSYWINKDKRKQVSTNQLQLWPNIVSVNVLSQSLPYLMTCEVRKQVYKIIAVIMSNHNHTQNLHNTYSLRTSVFWDVARRLVVGFRRFRTTYRSHLQISYAALRPRRAKAETQVWNLAVAFCCLKCWITHFFALSRWHFGRHAHYLHRLSEVLLRSPDKYQDRTLELVHTASSHVLCNSLFTSHPVIRWHIES
jgi:hypothetical protein